MFPRTLGVGMLEVNPGRSLSAPSAGTDTTHDWWPELSKKGTGFGLVDKLPVAPIP